MTNVNKCNKKCKDGISVLCNQNQSKNEQNRIKNVNLLRFQVKEAVLSTLLVGCFLEKFSNTKCTYRSLSYHN